MGTTTTEKRNMELMQTLDDAWNAQDVETFRKRHTDDVVVTWPGGMPPTRGIEAHSEESIAFWKPSRIKSWTTIPIAFSSRRATGRARLRVSGER